MSAEEASGMVGGDVPAADATVTEATVAVDSVTGAPVYGYLPLGGVDELRRAVLTPVYGEGMIRATGVRNRGRAFGYGPRRPVYRREGCGATSLAGEHPEAHRVITHYSDRLAVLLGDIHPELVESARAAVSVVSPDWRLGDSKLWTSGVVNQSAVLPWHRDAFNFPAWSAMPVLRRHMTGGYLRIPEYGAVIPCRDGWGVFFAGYELLHGVTPMRLTRADGYRYSIVYYALRGMKNCFDAAEETKYALKRRTEREQSMARRLAAGELPPIDTRRHLPHGVGEGSRIMGGKNQRDFIQVTAVLAHPPITTPLSPNGDPVLLEDAHFTDMSGSP